VVRALVRRHLAWVGRTFGRRGGILGLTFSIAMLAAACAEYLGTHAAFGAFLAGVALGGAPDFDARTREPIERIASFVLAPLFFATLGLRIDFLASFDPPLVAAVVVVACAGKLLGASCAARLAGLPAREAWAAGAALNARGGMEIILGLLALRSGLVGERLFVALVATALLTSIAAGPSIRLALRGAPRSPGRAAPEAPEPQGP
jgi:Kef-type K+ transport system membrane component KefB